MKYKNLLIISLLTFILTACGTFKVRDKNIAEVNKIGKAAVVAFSLVEPVPPNFSLDLTKGLTAEPSSSFFAKSGKNADQM